MRQDRAAASLARPRADRVGTRRPGAAWLSTATTRCWSPPAPRGARLPQARRLLDQARRANPFDPRTASARGRLAFLERRFADAVEDLLEAALLRPDGLPDGDRPPVSARRAGPGAEARSRAGRRPSPRPAIAWPTRPSASLRASCGPTARRSCSARSSGAGHASRACSIARAGSRRCRRSRASTRARCSRRVRRRAAAARDRRLALPRGRACGEISFVVQGRSGSRGRRPWATSRWARRRPATSSARRPSSGRRARATRGPGAR